MNNYSGNLVSIEGIDGSGKGTVIEALKEEYYPDLEYTQEPSNGAYGRIMREELESDSDPTVSDFFLFMADRYDHCQSLIGPKLDVGEDVITDRYHLSTFAYQSKVIREQMDIAYPHEYIQEVTGDFVIEPDLTILIDVPVEVTLQRLDEDKEKYEGVDKLEEARKVYRGFAFTKEHVKMVDGTQDPENVIEDVVELIDGVLYDF